MDEKETERKNTDIEIYPTENALNIIVNRHPIGPLKEQDPKYILRIVNRIPVLVFLGDNPEDSFFKEINYPLILQRADTDWVDQPQIKISLVSKDANGNNESAASEEILLSPSDSGRIRESCKNQIGKTAEYIESSIIHIYGREHQHEWLQNFD
ncbi:hypothetical protein L0657_23975 [Dyadobacter sp. CY345]|uniref:hypothetical protein n=1 Tax=Dyadobacter sp. CY345 TaxID=2909335 RepID=UPI001F3B00F5|nr:hypothetical protein [Dyadobacter sp. CY345]MCF2447033.1 hypothetical protein [Dyadobacter sp. CY345]